jgi:hypothetical protein
MKKDWHPFKGMDIAFCFRGTPTKWIRGKVVSWHKYWFEFLRNDRKRPWKYLEEEIMGFTIYHREQL